MSLFLRVEQRGEEWRPQAHGGTMHKGQSGSFQGRKEPTNCSQKMIYFYSPKFRKYRRNWIEGAPSHSLIGSSLFFHRKRKLAMIFELALMLKPQSCWSLITEVLPPSACSMLTCVVTKKNQVSHGLQKSNLLSRGREQVMPSIRTEMREISGPVRSAANGRMEVLPRAAPVSGPRTAFRVRVSVGRSQVKEKKRESPVP